MKKILLLIAIFLAGVPAMYSQSPHQTVSTENGSTIKGGRLFTDLGYVFGVGEYGDRRVELNASYGYQFNPYFFLGAGTGVHCWSFEEFLIPLFAELRGTFTKGRIAPFLSFRIGYSFNANESFEDVGIYLSPFAGVRIMQSGKRALNVSVGYSGQEDKFNIPSYYGRYERKEFMSGVAIKVGYEF